MRERRRDARRSAPPWKVLGRLMLIGGLVLADRELLRSRRRRRAFPDDAPPHARTGLALDRPAAAASVLVDAPREALQAFWRDPANLPRLIPEPSAVTPQEDGSFVWILERGSERLRLHLRLAEDRAGESLAWESLGGDAGARSVLARLAFREAPGGRGTLVGAEIDRPSGLAASPLDAALRQALRRFRMLVETGEIAVAAAPLPREATCAP